MNWKPYAKEIVAALLAGLDEDERIALAVADHRQRAGELRWTQCDPDREPGLIGDQLGNVVTYDEGSPSQWQAAHIARHDPERVLAEVDAKRRILAEHARGQAGFIWIKSAEVKDRSDVHEERTNAQGVTVARVPLWICTRCADWHPDAQADEDSHTSHEFPCLTLRALALPYADRLGSRDE